MFKSLALQWAVSRAREASTWAGLLLSVSSSLHIDFNTDFKTSCVNLGLALGGVFAVIVKEGIRK